MADELFILADDELDYIRKKSFELIGSLPDEAKTSLMILAFLTKHIEEASGLTVKGINIAQKRNKQNG